MLLLEGRRANRDGRIEWGGRDCRRPPGGCERLCELLLRARAGEAEAVAAAVEKAGVMALAVQADVAMRRRWWQWSSRRSKRSVESTCSSTTRDRESGRAARAGSCRLGAGAAHEPDRRLPLPARGGEGDGRRRRGRRSTSRASTSSSLAWLRALLRVEGCTGMLATTAARELAPKKVRVLNIAPGAIATPINKFVLDDPEATHAVEEEIPLGWIGSADEVAEPSRGGERRGRLRHRHDDRRRRRHVAVPEVRQLMEAFGSPGRPTWTSSAKDAVTTGLGPSRLWATLGFGIVNEVYWPTTGMPQMRDLGFIVAERRRLVRGQARQSLRDLDAGAALPLPRARPRRARATRLMLEFLPDPVARRAARLLPA